MLQVEKSSAVCAGLHALTTGSDRTMRVRLTSSFLLLCVIVACGGHLDAVDRLRGTTTAQPMEVWTVDSLTRVQPHDQPRPSSSAVRLKAARNEFEAVQVILRSHAPLRAVSATVTDLTGPRGNRIGKEQILLFREHYIYVSRPSPKSPFPPGWWPDALIPFRNPDTHLPLAGDRFPAGTFDLEPEHNQPLWVEIYVPGDTPAGLYHGVIGITMNGRPLSWVPVTLEVWDFSLPAAPSVRSDFGGFERAAKFHRVSPETPEYLPLVRRYEDSLIRHRLMPYRPTATAPSVAPDGTVDLRKVHSVMQHYMDRVGINSWRIPLGPRQPFPDTLGKDRERTIRYLRSLYTYMEGHGWGNRTFIYPVDEPHTPEEYRQVREFAALAHEAHRDIKLLLTDTPIPDKPGPRDLFGAVNIWVVLFAAFDEASVGKRLAAGDEVWSYTALVQGDKPVAHWQLDFPLLNYRIPLWINWRYGIRGLLYWTTVYWKETDNPWVNPISYDGAYNGEGILFYPGTAVGYDGPVPSIRLKAIRDGMEDYEYLKLLADNGDKAFADTVARRIAGSWSEWKRDPSRVLQAREELAVRILRLQTQRHSRVVASPSPHRDGRSYP